MNDKRGKLALVTGASRGLGAAITRRLATDGVAVAINYMSSSALAEKLVAEILLAGGNAAAFAGDVADAVAFLASDRAKFTMDKSFPSTAGIHLNEDAIRKSF